MRFPGRVRLVDDSGARRKLLEGRSRRCADRLGLSGLSQVGLVALLVLASLALLAGCGGGGSGSGGEAETPEETTSSGEAVGEGTSGNAALSPADTTVGENEETAMPAGGRQEDPAQAPPENPPEGVRTFPATTNRNVEGSISYDQDPPTHGDHAPYWQRCG